MKKMYKLASVVAVIGALVAGISTRTAFAGPLVAVGGKSATPGKYEVTIKTLELRRNDGSYFTVFSGSATIDLGNNSVAAGGIGGTIGAGVVFPPGTYNGFRATFARSFNVNSSAANVGPAAAATCSTGNGGADIPNYGGSGYTLQAVIRNGATTDRAISIPPEADAAINTIQGLAVVGGDIQVTATIPAFILAATDTKPPTLGVQFDVANKVEFLNDGANCVAIALPPDVTITTASGSVTLSPPAALQ